MNEVKEWMSWEGGVDLVAATQAGLAQPNVIVHVGRVVHTPLGSAPAGMVLWQPDVQAPPVVCAFVCADARIGGYFGPKIFAGTPFEKASVLNAKLEVITRLPDSVGSRVEVAGHRFEVTFSRVGTLAVANRTAGLMPFAQQCLESAASTAELKVDGKPITIFVPKAGMSGAPGACWTPAGIYAR